MKTQRATYRVASEPSSARLELPWRGRWSATPISANEATRFSRPMAAALLLLLSWLLPPFALVWNAVDVWLFRALNGSLAQGYAWQLTWAIANCRYFDLVAGFILLTLFGTFVLHHDRSERLSIVASLALTTLGAVAWQTLICGLLIEGIMHYERPSPSVMDPAAWRLSQLIPALKPKDSSPWCFPSDHGYVLATVIGYFSVKGDRRFLRISVVVGTLLSLPRLVSGAHWVSDIVVGSGVLALIFVALFLGTPLHDQILTWSMEFLRCRTGWEKGTAARTQRDRTVGSHCESVARQ